MNFRLLLCVILGLAAAKPAKALERLEPATGCYIGMLIADEDDIPRLSKRLGLTPAAVSRFYGFPLTPSQRQSLIAFLDDVRTHGGIAVLTLEPFDGLNAVTAVQCNDLADLCAQYEAQGIGGIMIRFAHEMNGNWYAWGQQPTLYRQTFQLLAGAIHSRTIRTAMLWSPNNGIGYPFGTGTYSPASGAPNFIELDTDHDGVLTQTDDMFGPFYPGDAAVDWVGLSVYHWGVNYPWLENEPAVPGEFAGVINATGPGSPANYSRWFYPRFCSDGVHNKPLVIAETSAFYNTEQPGANELAMKQAWFRQLYNISGAGADGPDVAVTFPKMKCVNWFDHYKRESEAQNQLIDWRASANPLVRSAFVSAVRTLRNSQPYFLTAQEFNATQTTNNLVAVDVPSILPLNGNVATILKVNAQVACDLEIDLLDQNYVFKGGTRITVAAGASTVSTSFALNQTLSDGGQYRWSIFLVSPGGSYLNALAWYSGPDPVARAATPFVVIESAPASVPANQSIKARVKFVASAEAALKITLFNANHDIRGGGTVSVKRGDGILDLTANQIAGNPVGTYSLQCTLSTPAANPQFVVAQTAEFPMQIATAPPTDLAVLAVEPDVVPLGEVFRFVVSYAATAARDLRLELSNSVGAIVATAVQPVSAGAASIDMTISYALATPGTYTARIHVVPPGGPSAQAIASSSVQTVQVVSAGYSAWLLTRWGVILGNDPISPVLDPDGDGTANGSEYVALTDPRNPASVLRTSLSRAGNQLTVSWPSTAGRNYQLFSRPILSSGSWQSVNSIQLGTGAMMAYVFDLTSAGAAKYYRVEATVP